MAFNPEMGLVVFSGRKGEEVIGIVRGRQRQLFRRWQQWQEAVGLKKKSIDRPMVDGVLSFEGVCDQGGHHFFGRAFTFILNDSIE